MSGHDSSQNADFEQASSTMNKGLKACRAMVRSYRELLAGAQARTASAAVNDDIPANDAGGEIFEGLSS